jgi:hypothetical protein
MEGWDHPHQSHQFTVATMWSAHRYAWDDEGEQEFQRCHVRLSGTLEGHYQGFKVPTREREIVQKLQQVVCKITSSEVVCEVPSCQVVCEVPTGEVVCEVPTCQVVSEVPSEGLR